MNILMSESKLKIAVCIPCYKVKSKILQVIETIPDFIDKIYIIDDCCPEQSGEHVRLHCSDLKVEIISHQSNRGVGGAVMTGYRRAIEEKMDITVKIDGDGQMDPGLIEKFVAPLKNGKADYTKGNRFHSVEGLIKMPLVRKIGNAGICFINKLSSGYWNIMDPSNGFTAIHIKALTELPLEKVQERYFFESDMLFRLGTIRAVVRDIPMTAIYEDEESNLSVVHTLFTFPTKYLSRFLKRLFYNYFLRDFNIGSLNLILASTMMAFGLSYGGFHWLQIVLGNRATTPLGVIMLATLPVILGYQSLLMFFSQDMNSTPSAPIQEDWV